MTSPLDADLCFGGSSSSSPGGSDFIGDVQSLVYVCGKTLNLLKLCQPSHHLCRVQVERQPTIRLLVSPLEVRLRIWMSAGSQIKGFYA